MRRSPQFGPSITALAAASGVMVLLVSGCTGPDPSLATRPHPRATSSATVPLKVPPMASVPATASAVATTTAAPVAPPVKRQASLARVHKALKPGKPSLDFVACPAPPKGAPPPPDLFAAHVGCLLKQKYADAPTELETVTKLFHDHGWIMGLDREHLMDGGWRGHIKIVPERPIGIYRRHLKWVQESADDFAWFFDALEKESGKKVDYKWRALVVRFFRSVKRTTPSAYANDSMFAYNVKGSLLHTSKGVRETLFHEIFHLNDTDKDRWSGGFQTLHEQLLDRCTTKAPGGREILSTACLTPFAPSSTKVRGGTFYAFQPGNGVWEYGAELAVRYYNEHRAILKKTRWHQQPFKCTAPENAEPWESLADTFFGGIDLVPPCEG